MQLYFLKLLSGCFFIFMIWSNLKFVKMQSKNHINCDLFFMACITSFYALFKHCFSVPFLCPNAKRSWLKKYHFLQVIWILILYFIALMTSSRLNIFLLFLFPVFLSFLNSSTVELYCSCKLLKKCIKMQEITLYLGLKLLLKNYKFFF